MAKKKQIKFPIASPMANMSLSWRSVFLLPIYAQVSLLVLGAFSYNQPLSTRLSLFITYLAFFFYRFLANLASRHLVIDDGMIKVGYKSYEIADLQKISVPINKYDYTDGTIILHFGPGNKNSLKLELANLGAENSEKLIEILSRRVSGLHIEPRIEEALQNLRPLKQDKLTNPNELVLPYKLHGFIRDFPAQLKSAANFWLQSLGPLGTLVIATPIWLTSALALFNALRNWSDVQGNRLFYELLSSFLFCLQSYSFTFQTICDNSGIGRLFAYMIWAGLALLVYYLFKVIYSTNTITVNRQGVEADFMAELWSEERGRVNFDYLEKIELVGGTRSASPDKWKIKLTSRISTFFGERKKEEVIELGAVAPSDRDKLLKAFQEFAPPSTLSLEVTETLKSGAEKSYTDLWLQSLSDGNIRKNIEPLREGALLQEGRYQIIDKIGIGGEGTAYQALDREELASGKVKKVVLKETIIPPYLDRPAEYETLEKIKKETEILASIKSDLVVQCHGFFLEDRRTYIVLEYIEGKNLRQYVKERGPLPQAEVVRLALIMCDILEALHSKQVIHRDFTPDNIIIAPDGSLKLIDFAVATENREGVTGTIVGKHSYVPAEQFRGYAENRSDIYAMASTLFFLLTGIDPEPITQSNPSEKGIAINQSLNQLIKECTSQIPSERPASAAQIRERLSEIELDREESFVINIAGDLKKQVLSG